MTTPPLDRAALRELLDRATPGPWQDDGDGIGHEPGRKPWHVQVVGLKETGTPYNPWRDLILSKEDAALIVALRNQAASLLDALDAAERERETLTVERDEATALANANGAECDEARADVVAAAGELRVPIPPLGSDAARLLIANKLMQRERDAALASAAAAEREAERLRDILHDAEATPLAEWATELAAARENVAGTVALLHEAESRAAAAEAEVERVKSEKWEAACLGTGHVATDAKHALAEARAEVERLRVYEPRIISLTYENGETKIVGRSEGATFGEFALTLAGWLAEAKGENYAEIKVTHPDCGEMAVTVQRCVGKTPHEFRVAAEAALDSARADSARLRSALERIRNKTAEECPDCAAGRTACAERDGEGSYCVARAALAAGGGK